MKEYIDREALIAEYDRVHQGPAGGARKLMVDAPAADVVEVVRCKDCKYCELRSDIITDSVLYVCTAWMHPHCVDERDFCSYGERKEN